MTRHRPGLAWITCTATGCTEQTTVYEPHAANLATHWRCDEHKENR